MTESKAPVLFKKPLVEPVPAQPLVGQLKKNNVGLFIKKKPVEVKTEMADVEPSVSSASASVATKPTTSLLNMMSSYADSDDSDQSSD